MKRITIPCLVVFTAFTLVAQLRPLTPPGPPARSPQQSSENKLVGWLTDLDEAKAQAVGAKRLIYAFFTDGSPHGILIQKELLTSTRFKDFAADNFVLLLVEYPTVKPVNEEALKKAEEMMRACGVATNMIPMLHVLSEEGRGLFPGGINYKAGQGDGAYLSELRDFIETKDYTINDKALEGYVPTKAAAMPTPGTPVRNAPPPPISSQKTQNDAFQKLKEKQKAENY